MRGAVTMLDKREIIKQLRRWSSCDVRLLIGPGRSLIANHLFLQIADGLTRLKHLNGGFLEGLTLYSPHFQSGSTKIVGPAYTVKFVPKSDIVAPILSGHYVSLLAALNVVLEIDIEPDG